MEEGVSELRFIERDGKKVLQQWVGEMRGSSKVWLDVPCAKEEPNKQSLDDALRDTYVKWSAFAAVYPGAWIWEYVAAEAKRACVDAILNLYRPWTPHSGDVMANVREIIRLINEL